MINFDHSASVTFFIRRAGPYAYRRMFAVPRVGDRVVFHGIRYLVEIVEWCLDEDATEVGVKVNVEITKIPGIKPEFKQKRKAKEVPGE